MLDTDYRLIFDAYYGTGGFCSGSYLTRHKREVDRDYTARQENAYYLNYFAPITNALVTPIFKKPATRDWTGAASLMEKFMQDVDGSGTNMAEFMKSAALKAKLYGSCFIIVDNFSTGGDDTMADVLQKRRFPYAYCLAPQQIIDYEADKMGRLSRIEFRDSKQTSPLGNEYYTMRFDRQGWRRTDSDNSIIEQGTYNFGCVPAVVLMSKNLSGLTLMPPSELLPLAKVNRTIYNLCSWLNEILKNVTFPILTLPSLDAKDVIVGNNNALGYNPEFSHEPDFIAPPSDPANILKEQILNMVQEMYRMAGLSFVTGSKTDTSGVSKQWDFERLNQQLADFAAQIQTAEINIVRLFGLWMNQQIDYRISYPDDFNISDIAYELQNAQALIDLGLSDELKIEVLKKLLSLIFPDMESVRFDEIVKSAENKIEEDKNAFGSQPNDRLLQDDEDEHDEEDK